MHNRFAFLSLAALLLGCTSSVVAQHDTGSSTGQGGQGGATSASSVGGYGGVGGIGGSGGSSTTGTPTACSDTDLFVDIEGDGPVQHIDASCMPLGEVLYPGGPKIPPPDPQHALSIEACTVGQDYRLSFITDQEGWPASGNIVQGSYLQSGGATYSTASTGSILVTSFGQVGGVIEGTFSLMVKDEGSAATLMLSGKFRVCRGPDQIPV